MKSATQLINEANELKGRLSGTTSLSNNELWTVQFQFQNICGELLIGCQEIALEQGIERELWNLGFRNTITQLQTEVKNKQGGSVGSEAKDLLMWFLNSASGFYLQFLNQLCSIYSLDLPFRRKDSLYGITSKNSWQLSHIKQKEGTVKNAKYLCQYCLVHLGDLARYRHQARQAETFYRHAVSIGPTSGHAYNQLALLEAGRGNKLSAVALYIRAVCVQAPFPKAPSNLLQTLHKILSNGFNKSKSDGKQIRMTKDEYAAMFLNFHTYLLLKGETTRPKQLLPQLSSALSTLVATNSLTRSMLAQMVTIGLFGLYYFNGNMKALNTDDCALKNEITSDFVDPKNCKCCSEVVEELLVAILAALLLPVHTIKDPEILLTYTALPAIRLLLEWLRLEDKVTSSALRRKQQIWPGLCTLVNALQVPLHDFDLEFYENCPLPEDWDLQGFQPMQNMLSKYKFKEGLVRPTLEEYNLIRCVRLTELANWFSKQTIDGNPIIKLKIENGPPEEKRKVSYEPYQHSSPSPEEVKALEQLTSRPTKPIPKTDKPKGKNVKVGILKPEGSLEKGQESTSQKKPKAKVHLEAPDPESSKPCQQNIGTGNGTGGGGGSGRSRARSNVALQAILKRKSAVQEAKQVTFKTPSPAISPNLSQMSNDTECRLSTPPLNQYGSNNPQDMNKQMRQNTYISLNAHNWPNADTQIQPNPNNLLQNMPPHLMQPPPPYFKPDTMTPLVGVVPDLSIPPPGHLPPDLPNKLAQNVPGIQISSHSPTMDGIRTPNFNPSLPMGSLNPGSSSTSGFNPSGSKCDKAQSREFIHSGNCPPLGPEQAGPNMPFAPAMDGVRAIGIPPPNMWNQWNCNKRDTSAQGPPPRLPTSLQELIKHPPPNLQIANLPNTSIGDGLAERDPSKDPILSLGLPQSFSKLNLVPGNVANPLASLPISQPQHPLSQEAGEGRVQGVSTYSLFSPMSSVGDAMADNTNQTQNNNNQTDRTLHHPLFPLTTPPPSGSSHQSLWSGPGPSPLERLLEQRKYGGSSK